jgi:hypothetical protein
MTFENPNVPKCLAGRSYILEKRCTALTAISAGLIRKAEQVRRYVSV